MNAKLSHVVEYKTSHSVISHAMSEADTPASINAAEYFKLPGSGSRMEYALVLAGAVAGWCLKPEDNSTLSAEEAATHVKGPAHVSASLGAVCSRDRVKLSISYRGFDDLESEPFGHNIVSVAGDQIGKMCFKIVDPH